MGLKGFKLYFATSQQTLRKVELESSIQVFVLHSYTWPPFVGIFDNVSIFCWLEVPT
jgi:hypothetical protein